MKKILKLLGLTGLTLGLFAVLNDAAVAGSSTLHNTNHGTDFNSIYNLMNEWIRGSLGRTIALAAFILGIGIGALKQNGVIALSGIMFAVFIIIVPSVIDNLITALI